MRLFKLFSLFFLLLPSNITFAADSVEKMKDAISRLQSGVISYYFVDVGITHNELKILSNLKVRNTRSYSRFTRLHMIYDELPSFLRDEVGSLDETANALAVSVIARISQAVVKASGKDTAWVTVRTFESTDEYNIPRWHTDGAFFKPYDARQLKFASVLKGPSTIFHPLPDCFRSQFEAMQAGRESSRFELAEFIKQTGVKSQQPAPGQGVFFLVGNSDYSAVHSEPTINDERVFFSVVPGTENEITELANSWKESL